MKLKLTKAVTQNEVLFAFGVRQVPVTKEGSDMDDKDAQEILAQFPGWVEPVTAGKPEKTPALPKVD